MSKRLRFLPAKAERLKWLNYLYFIRFSLGLWLIMPVLAMLDWLKITSSVTLGILTPDTFWQLAFSSFFVVASGWLALTLARVTCAYGKERFVTEPPGWMAVGRNMCWSTFLFAQAPGLVLIARVAVNTHVEGEVPDTTITFSLITGALGAFFFWVAVAILYYWTYQPTFKGASAHAKTTARAFLIPDGPLLRLDQMEALPSPPVALFVRSLLTRFASFLKEGYERPRAKVNKLHSGHGVALFLFSGYFALYVALMGITAPRRLLLVENSTRILVIVVLAIALVNYILGRKTPPPPEGVDLEEPDSSEEEEPGPLPRTVKPYPRWYRFLSRVALALMVLLAIVIFVQPHSERVFPVLASIFVLFTFATLALSGLAFWADHYRIPVLTLAILFITVVNLRPLRTDHQFEAPELSAAPAPPTPDEVFKSMEPDGRIRPLIIVTSTGGGIHAAVWTAEVLSLLDRHFPKTDAADGRYGFHDSLLLASTVSGGSVGMMNFLREYKTSDPFNPANLDDHLVKSAACSSLEAVAWGLIYPDVTRLVFPVLFRVKSLAPYDRGLALEQAINDNLSDPGCDPHVFRSNSSTDATLSTLLPGETRASTFFPAFTLNTTATETGDRFLLSNYQVERKDDKYCDFDKTNLHSDLLPAESFLQSYAEPCPSDGTKRRLADLHLSTAARLSASFTYVSPAARIARRYVRYGYHFVDGGYYDNDGTGSAIEFLQALNSKGALPTDKIQPILLIEIRNGSDVYSDRSPDSYSCQNAHCTTTSVPTPWGPWRQFTAPPQAMYLAGHESITRRNRRELCILETDLAPVQDRNGHWHGVVIHHVVFSVNDGDAALSWHLTQTQKDFLRSVVPDERCDGSKCVDINVPGAEQTMKSLHDALGWFAATQKDPNVPHPEDVCRVYP